jgi:hypothetical protein
MEIKQKYVLTDPSNYAIDTIFNPNDHVMHMGSSLSTLKILLNPTFYYPASANLVSNFQFENNGSIERELSKKLSLEHSPSNFEI